MGMLRTILLLAAIGSVQAEVRFADFRTAKGLRLVGSASVGAGVLRLTPAKQDKAGAAWAAEKQPVAGGFDTTFQFRLTNQGGLGAGADGIAFVLQNSGPAAIGGLGSAGGFAVSDPAYRSKVKGIPFSVAVFFDTFRNTDEDDPSANFVALRTHGKPNEMRWPATRLAFTPQLAVDMKDGKVHTARIVFRPPVLSVSLDGAAVLQAAVDLSIVVDGQGSAWVGLTASTGSGYEDHDVLNWSFHGEKVSSGMSVVSSEVSFQMSECLADRNLCTPEGAKVEPHEGGYHVVLPANREWGASIPNPEAKGVAMEHEQGIVCWDLKARGSDGCSGPAGSGARGGEGFLVPDAAAGALVMSTHDGRSWFSVNGRRMGFGENEGFFEFDVRLK
jgi:hypothetical protein